MKRFVFPLLWPLSGALMTGIAAFPVLFVYLMVDTGDFVGALVLAGGFSALMLLGMLGHTLWLGILCLGWPHVAKRAPKLERPLPMQAVFISLASLMTLAATGFSEDISAIGWATGFISVYLPLSLPRLVLPAFRPGCFLPRPSANSV